MWSSRSCTRVRQERRCRAIHIRSIPSTYKACYFDRSRIASSSCAVEEVHCIRSSESRRREPVPAMCPHGYHFRPKAYFVATKSEHALSQYNGVLYEQVTDVNLFPYQGLCFCCCRCVCCCSPPGLYSHSDELGVIFSSVPVGVREESRCCDLSDGLGGPKRRRSHRNAVWVATGELYAAC